MKDGVRIINLEKLNDEIASVCKVDSSEIEEVENAENAEMVESQENTASPMEEQPNEETNE